MKTILLVLFFMIFSFILINPIYAENISLTPSDDAFVLFGPDDPNDLMKSQIVNIGNEPFLEIWSNRNALPELGNLNSIIYLKFDLRDLDLGNIEYASLRIFPDIINIENQDEIELFYSPDTDWNESKITYLTRPVIDLEPIFTLEITPQQTWHEFDIIEFIEKNAGSEITLALSFKEKLPNHERSIAYFSKESADSSLAPLILISQKPITGPTLEERVTELEKKVLELEQKNESGGCLIATATYGTELAPQVQLLREIRDNTLLQTNSGKSFMNSFNDVYYSFSPIIADYERENPIFREAVKIAITPLISSLSILNYVDINSDAEMLSYGISLIILNLAMYVGMPASVIVGFRKLNLLK